jgi:hypothetical protein
LEVFMKVVRGLSLVSLVGALGLMGCASLLSEIGGGGEASGPAEPSASSYVDPGPWAGPLHQKYAIRWGGNGSGIPFPCSGAPK